MLPLSIKYLFRIQAVGPSVYLKDKRTADLPSAYGFRLIF